MATFAGLSAAGREFGRAGGEEFLARARRERRASP